MKEIKAIIQPFMLEQVLRGLAALEGLPGVTVSEVKGWGRTRGTGGSDPSEGVGHRLADKTKLEIVVSDRLAYQVVQAIATSARTGNFGDGKIFVSDVADAVKVRTGEHSQEIL